MFSVLHPWRPAPDGAELEFTRAPSFPAKFKCELQILWRLYQPRGRRNGTVSVAHAHHRFSHRCVTFAVSENSKKKKKEREKEKPIRATDVNMPGWWKPQDVPWAFYTLMRPWGTHRWGPAQTGHNIDGKKNHLFWKENWRITYKKNTKV